MANRRRSAAKEQFWRQAVQRQGVSGLSIRRHGGVPPSHSPNRATMASAILSFATWLTWQKSR